MTGSGDAARDAISQVWDTENGERWAADANRRDRVLAPVGEALLATARLQPGEHVLDIGCGCGATTLQAAAEVAPGGTATGIDISAAMLGVARARQAADGPGNARFVHADAQTHPVPGPFDAAISRFGTMFFNDPVTAFLTLGAGLRPGARLVMATWQPLAANQWLTMPGAALLRHGTLPDTGQGPGMFAQSEPAVVERVLTEAGFARIQLEDVRLRLTFGADLDEAIDYLSHSGPGRTVLATVPEADRDAALDDVRAALADHADACGVHLEAAIWLITATRP
ncbi:methyltransferase domain-containing protein [Nonomuraea sp. B19D2]|uniref:class I SAM-dependent methyltransferase n=1 Tax=Nonomuraea sp. B19D2 TaxID=3159561 RepID=UPI0032DA31C6